MISDVLFESVNEIDRYLNDPVYNDMYAGELRQRIVTVRDHMHALRAELDLPPLPDVQPISQPQSIKDFQAIGRGLRELPPLVLMEGFELPPKGTIVAPAPMVEQMEVAGKMSIDETKLMINKRTGALGFQFKVSFKPETDE